MVAISTTVRLSVRSGVFKVVTPSCRVVAVSVSVRTVRAKLGYAECLASYGTEPMVGIPVMCSAATAVHTDGSDPSSEPGRKLLHCRSLVMCCGSFASSSPLKGTVGVSRVSGASVHLKRRQGKKKKMPCGFLRPKSSLWSIADFRDQRMRSVRARSV